MEGVTRVTRALQKRLNSVDGDISTRPNTPQKSEMEVIRENVSTPKRRTRQNSKDFSTPITMPPITPVLRLTRRNSIAAEASPALGSPINPISRCLNSEDVENPNEVVTKPKNINSIIKSVIEEDESSENYKKSPKELQGKYLKENISIEQKPLVLRGTGRKIISEKLLTSEEDLIANEIVDNLRSEVISQTLSPEKKSITNEKIDKLNLEVKSPKLLLPQKNSISNEKIDKLDSEVNVEESIQSNVSKKLSNSNQSIPSDDEDKSSDSNNKNCEYIDDDAEETNGEDSLDEEERQYLKDNEIPERGEILGSENSESIEEEQEEEEYDSFVISDESEHNKLLSTDSEEELIERNKKNMKAQYKRIQVIDSNESDSDVEITEDVDIGNKMEIADKTTNTILTISTDGNAICSSKKNSILNISKEESDAENSKQNISQKFVKKNSLSNKKVNLNQNASSHKSVNTSQNEIENFLDFSLEDKNKLILNSSKDNNSPIVSIEIDKKTQAKKNRISETENEKTPNFGKNKNVFDKNYLQNDQIQSKIESPKNKKKSVSKDFGSSEEYRKGLEKIKSPEIRNISFNKNLASSPKNNEDVTSNKSIIIPPSNDEKNEENQIANKSAYGSFKNKNSSVKGSVSTDNNPETDSDVGIDYRSETENNKEEDFDKMTKSPNKSIVKTSQNNSFSQSKIIPQTDKQSGEDGEYGNIKNQKKSLTKSPTNKTILNKNKSLNSADDEISVDCKSVVQHKTVNDDKTKEPYDEEKSPKILNISQKYEKKTNISIESNQSSSDEQITNSENNENGNDQDQFQSESIDSDYNENDDKDYIPEDEKQSECSSSTISEDSELLKVELEKMNQDQNICKSKPSYSFTSITEYKPVQQKNKLSKSFISDNRRVSDDSDNLKNFSKNNTRPQISDHNLSEAEELEKLITNEFKIKPNNRNSMIEKNNINLSSKKSRHSLESTHINCNDDIFQDLREKLSKNKHNSDNTTKSCTIDENVSCNLEENNIKLNQSGDFNQVTQILNRCDEILEAASRAKREAKLQYKLDKNEKLKKMKIKKNKFEENSESSSDTPTQINPHQKQIKEAAIIKALNYGEIMIKNKTTHKISEKPAIANSRLLPPGILDAIIDEKPKINKQTLKDYHRQHSELRELSDIENETKSCEKLKRKFTTDIEIKALQLSKKNSNIILNPSGMFIEEPITPPKIKKIISQRIRSGTVYEEPITPESKKIMNGFKECPITPKAIGFKVRSILSAGQKEPPVLNLEKKLQKRKRKNIPETNRSLPKSIWTKSGEFIEENLEVSRKKIKLDESIATDFYVTPIEIKKSTSCVKNHYFGINSNALEFKKNAMKNSKIRRESSKEMLQGKERQNIYNKF